MTIAPDISAIAIEDLNPYERDVPPSSRAHIINPPMNTHIWEPGMETREIVDIARLTDQEVVALCGHRWVPKHDPAPLKVCDPCLDRAHQLIRDRARRMIGGHDDHA